RRGRAPGRADHAPRGTLDRRSESVAAREGGAMSGETQQFTLGIEEEFQLIDPETRDLRPHVQHLLADRETGPALRDQLKPELHQSVIEVGTKICADIGEARREVMALRRDLASLARRNGLT